LNRGINYGGSGIILPPLPKHARIGYRMRNNINPKVQFTLPNGLSYTSNYRTNYRTDPQISPTPRTILPDGNKIVKCHFVMPFHRGNGVRN